MWSFTLGGLRSHRTFTNFTILTFLLLVRKNLSVPLPNLELVCFALTVAGEELVVVTEVFTAGLLGA